jgi:8-oxo-dGTP pyrophosphatase MutT (NUDIX family)
MRLQEVLLVVWRPGPEFLVLLRSPERHGYWNLVAGGVEEGEAPAVAALRELDEESGLAEPVSFESLPLELAYVRPEGSRIALYAFSAETPRGWKPVLNDEHVEYRWCSAADADALLAYPEPREAVRWVARQLRVGAL